MTRTTWFKRDLPILLSLIGMLLTGISLACANAPTLAATRSAANEAQKGEAVAIIYYYCKLDANKKCTSAAPAYYVHNSVALAKLPTQPGDAAHVGHVATWRTVDSLSICGATAAAETANHKPPSGVRCHEDGDPQETGYPTRPWAWTEIRPYARQAIAWTDGAEVHNGAFVSFEKNGQSYTDLKTACPQGDCGEGTLHYKHVWNPHGTGPDGGRTASAPGKFQVNQDAKATGHIKICRLEPTTPKPSCT